MKIEKDNIITFGNSEKYLVISQITKDNQDYYYIAELDKNGKDIKDNYKIMVATKEEEKIFLDEVVGENNLKSVLPLFVNNITQN